MWKRNKFKNANAFGEGHFGLSEKKKKLIEPRVTAGPDCKCKHKFSQTHQII